MKTEKIDFLTEKTKEKVRGFYNNFAKDYDKNRYASEDQKFNDTFAKKIVAEIVGDCNGKMVLDCGCGTGRFVEFFYKAGAVIVGSDISDNMLKIAKERVPTATFVKADVFSLPFKDKNFDIVICSQVLTHLHNYEKPLSEMKRVLKDNGIIVIDVRNILWPSRLPILIRKMFKINSKSDGDYNPDYVSIIKIKKICDKIGLKVEDFFGTGFPRAKQDQMNEELKKSRSKLKYIAPTLILKIIKKT